MAASCVTCERISARWSGGQNPRERNSEACRSLCRVLRQCRSGVRSVDSADSQRTRGGACLLGGTEPLERVREGLERLVLIQHEQHALKARVALRHVLDDRRQHGFSGLGRWHTTHSATERGKGDGLELVLLRQRARRFGGGGVLLDGSV